MKKLILVPWFGDFPKWFPEYLNNIKHLEQQEYDWLFMTDLDQFNKMISDKLSIDANVESGTSQSHNYRPAFGVLFEEALKGYDFWGITDLDCVYGDIQKFMPDSELESLDIWSNHHNYICGPWTLFRNSERVNNLFREVPNWQEHMSNKSTQPGRWTEVEYTHAVETNPVFLKYTHFQSKDPNDLTKLTYKDGHLFDDGEEIMTAHFNRKKIWPLEK